ncbi:class I SAM-dependent methyltransferase [Salimicrobium halophilum]|uniref:Tellurite resistance protein TehB n=1 Tax=Salimicrobium halophilum TaxID=86666 RepID=A0A1G8RDD6_9BACI|nr:class I SAM-dependent methyltransferase [Salimicrobium halophilum]SDJ14986.1 Tellurite resistance protein TehB [Salimicrobium halophilum]
MKKSSYDTHYRQTDYFGDPYPGLVEFFEAYEPKGHVLDLGCGQGRDSLSLGRLGYEVTGIDVSSVGIEQMNRAAREENLEVTGVVEDIYTCPVETKYDIVLLDSMLHFYKKDEEKETALVRRIASELKNGGVLAIFMIEGMKREAVLKGIFDEMDIPWTVLADRYTDYTEFSARYHMYILKKS